MLEIDIVFQHICLLSLVFVAIASGRQYSRGVILIACLSVSLFCGVTARQKERSLWLVHNEGSFVTSILTYNFSNTAATDIKYLLVESFKCAECFWKVLNSMSM